jgi:hypothetical protein
MNVLDREKPSAHAKLSPSSSERWILCPGSVQAQAEVQSADDGNADSRLGTAAHALLETCLIVGCEPEALIGTHLAGDDHPPVDEDMCEWVRVALDYIEEYIDTYGEENLWVLPETKVPIGPQINITGDDEKDIDLCNGTSDTIIAHRDMSMCVVIDYKNGMNKVSPKENTQCMLYAAGARQVFGKFKKYRSVIIQPRAGKRSPVEEWEFTDAMLRKFLETKVRPAARAAIQPNAPRSAGSHCQWCKASARCRTRKDKAYAVAGVEFDAMPDEPDPARLTDDEFREVLEHAKFLEQFVSAVYVHAENLLARDPHALPGWKLGWSKRTREWEDEAAVIEFAKDHGLRPDEYSPRELLSPAQMSKLLRKKLKPPRRKRGEPPAPDPVDAFVRYSVPKLKLVRDTEAQEEFDPLED